MRNKLFAVGPACLLALLAPPSAAQAVRLDTLTVNAPQTPPLALVSVSADALTSVDQRSLSQWLNYSPGVFALNSDNAAQGVRVSIRGFGAQAAFGVRGIRVSLDGVPLTLPDGQSDLDMLDLDLIERVSVVRGPSASLFGNASGGVVTLSSRAINPGEARWRVEARGDGGRSIRGEISTAAGSSALRASLAQSHYDGPRDHSHVDARWTHLNWAHEGADYRLSAGLSDLQVDALDPGGLTASQMRADRSAARDANVEFNAGENIRQQRLHGRWEQQINAQWQFDGVTYVGQREFANRLPFSNAGQTAFDRSFAGLGLTLNGTHQTLLNLEQRLTLGLDTQWQSDERKRYDNLTAGHRGELKQSQHERAQSVGIFVRNSVALNPEWEVSAGLRHDWLTLKTSDRFLADGNDSGRRQLNDLSGDLNLQRTLGPHAWYLRLATAYQTPTINELANPAGGGFNPALESSRSRGLELGWQTNTALWSTQLVGFVIQSDDEIQSYELEDQPGRSFYRNAGKSQRYGADLAATWDNTRWRADLAYSLLIAEYAQGDLDGLHLPGLPRQTLNLTATHSWTQCSLALNLVARDALYANDANTLKVPGHVRANLIGRWTEQRSDHEFSVELAIDNLLATQYADNVRINAFGGRAFEPAGGRLARVNLNWRF